LEDLYRKNLRYLTTMNFLAHLCLSGHDPKIKVGNFIGDFVKGRDVYDRFEHPVAAGIELHREIDRFTDSHPVVKQSKTRLWPRYRHYSAVIVDLFYDHFLARLWPDFQPGYLTDFAADSYKTLLANRAILPEKVKTMLPYMMDGDWLSNYAHVEGIHQALSGMARRARFVSGMEQATSELKLYYTEFESEFRLFFPELQRFANGWLEQNLPAKQPNG